MTKKIIKSYGTSTVIVWNSEEINMYDIEPGKIAVFDNLRVVSKEDLKKSEYAEVLKLSKKRGMMKGIKNKFKEKEKELNKPKSFEEFMKLKGVKNENKKRNTRKN
jgi:hypothetical protein